MMFSFNDYYVLDGATGSNLQKAGMPSGVCPEQWICEHPDALIDLQKRYLSAGSDIVYAPTFGANRIKLAQYGLQDQQEELCKRLVSLSREAVGSAALVAGDLSSPGLFLKPFGDTSFDELTEVYREQVLALEKAGVDCYVAETLLSLAEARAAVLAVKSVSDKPVIVTMTFDESFHTVTGGSPEAALIAVQSMGADAFGINCSVGPELILKLIERISPFARIPLAVKPNAGMPSLNEDGKTVYSVQAEEFARHVPEFAALGVRLFGGCCGTDERYIAEIRARVDSLERKEVQDGTFGSLLCSERTLWDADAAPEKVSLSLTGDFGECVSEEEYEEGTLFEIHVSADSSVSDFEENQFYLNGPVSLVSDDGTDLTPFRKVYNGVLRTE